MSRQKKRVMPGYLNAPVVLVVEDSMTLLELYKSYLDEGELTVEVASTGADALAKIREVRPAVVLLDLQLPDMDGLDILRAARAEGCTASFVVMTAHGSVQRAVEAMQAGAEDFLVKPFDRNRLDATVRNQVEKQELARILQDYRNQDRPGLERMIGRSLPMQAVYRTIESAAPSKATVFITGFSGTGKELCAEAIHRLSPRARKPFVAINCAAIPRDLIESEIFGHVAGAFTGASRDRIGAASQADGGTLFLDEICELDFELQAKLLRFIQLETFKRVGGTKVEQADIRFICATNRDPLAEVRAGRFREDLYYRLHVIPIEMPAIRDRGEDIVLLAEHFLHEFAGREHKSFTTFDADARNALLAYTWPGNVRELQNVVQQIVVLNPGGSVTVSMLPPAVLKRADAGQRQGEPAGLAEESPQKRSPDVNPRETGEGGARQPPIRPLWMIEKEAIVGALEACGGDIQKAAVRLEISASTIYRKLQSWQKNHAD